MRSALRNVVTRVGTPVRCALLIWLLAACGQAAAVDFTQPHDPSDSKGHLYNVGPTGMLGIYNEAANSDQIMVRQVAKGSPADGKLSYGDVITGVNGVPFKKGGNIIVTLGNAIDDAEKEENGGKITLTVWRDANLSKRHASRNMNVKELDVTKFIEVIEADSSADLDRYKSERQLKESASVEWKEAYDKVPIQASVQEVTLTLRVMGAYSETSPWDCPKIKKIREEAYPHLVKLMEQGLGGWDRRTIPLALLASDHPEHVELVKKKMQQEGRTIRPHGRTWFAGYNITLVGEYVHRTGDKTFLPLLAELAHHTAYGQTAGGTWGHGYSGRHRPWTDPYGPGEPQQCSGNYGEMNAAGGPCFYGMVLAQKAGVEDPLVDDAIRRARLFHSTWVDRGGCPYGYHYPTGRETNNGKNGPPGLAMRLLGENYKANYFGLWCAVEASHGYMTGHGDGTFARFWPQLASCLAGKDAVIAWMKVVRPYYTMSRQYDGTFVCPSSGMGLGIGSLFDPTSMAVLHFSIPLAKLYMTGRDVPPECVATPKDLQNLRDRINRVPPASLSDDEILDRLDTFNVKYRRAFEAELVKRSAAGNDGILPKVKKLLDHKNARTREGALHVLAQCGLKALDGLEPTLIELLKDPVEIVRVAAVNAIKVCAAGSGGKKSLDLKRFMDPLLDAAITRHPDDTTDLVNTVNAVSNLMLNTDNAFARNPFKQGLDPDKVRQAMDRFVSMDPRGEVMDGPSKYWDRETCFQLAGPILFVASKEEYNCKMFRGRGMRTAREMLNNLKFIEAVETRNDDCYTMPRWPKAVRHDSRLTFSAQQGLGKSALPYLRTLLVDNMNATSGDMHLGEAIRLIEDYETPAEWTSLGEAATKAFLAEVDAVGDREKQIALCRSELKPDRKQYFRQIGAMTRLVEYIGAEAVPVLAPYLIQEEWRLNDHCRALIREMKTTGTAEALVRLTSSEDPIAVAALTLLGQRGDSAGTEVGLKLISTHKNPWVRGTAALAVYGGSQGANETIVKLLGLMKGLSDPKEIEGYEKALLMGTTDPKKASEISAEARRIMSTCSIPVRRSLYYVIGQAGGEGNLQYLKGQLRTPDKKETDEAKIRAIEKESADILDAISRSPDIAATQMLLTILAEHKGTEQLSVVSNISAKRMVTGASVIGRVPDDVNLDFAEAHLKLARNTAILRYLGNISTPRAIALLLNYMKLGPANVSEACAESIDRSASRLTRDLPLEQRKAIAQALTQVLEYITQVHLGGSRAVLSEEALKWKTLADSVGNNLRRIYSSDEILKKKLGEDKAEEDIDI